MTMQGRRPTAMRIMATSGPERRPVAILAENAIRPNIVVAESSGQVVASLLVTFEWSDWRDGAVWWIQSVFVRPDMRKQGIYAALYEHVRRLAAADESVKGIRLYVDRRNTAAQEVYRRLGKNCEQYQVFE